MSFLLKVIEVSVQIVCIIPVSQYLTNANYFFAPDAQPTSVDVVDLEWPHRLAGNF